MDNYPSPEQHNRGSKESLENLSRQLGFIENETLETIRELAVSASMEDRESAESLLDEYESYGQQLVSSLDENEYMRGQIGLIVAMATLHRDTGNTEAFLRAVADAREYAYGTYEDEAAAILEKAPSVELSRVLASLGEAYGFDEETTADIAAESYNAAFEIAYGYLTQAGFDADQVLASFIEINEER